MVSMERLEVRSIVSGKQDIDTRSDSITSGGRGILGEGELGGYSVAVCDDTEIWVSAPAQRRRSASDGCRASVRASAYALPLGSPSSKNELSSMVTGGGGRGWERERRRDWSRLAKGIEGGADASMTVRPLAVASKDALGRASSLKLPA